MRSVPDKRGVRMSSSVSVDFAVLDSARIGRLLTVQEFCAKVGVSRSSLWKIKRGGRLKLTTLRRVANVLRVPPASLVRTVCSQGGLHVDESSEAGAA